MTWLPRVLMPAGIVLGALLCGGALAMSRPSSPARTAEAPQRTAVTVVGVERGAVPLQLTVVGEVAAARDVPLASEVSGPLVWVAEGLHAGQAVRANEVVARIDPVPYQAQVAAAEATLADARQALALEVGSGSVAALEARLVGPVPGADEALVRREPQRAAAEAAVRSAEAALADARRQLDRTRLRAPFDALLAEESLDPGRLVTASTELGRWVGTDAAEITVRVAPQVLPWFADGGVDARVRPQGSSDDRPAERVVATGVVDPTTRTAALMVRVERPYDAEAGPVLLPGSFVEVTLSGGTLPDASRLPVTALVDGGAVWTVDGEDLLHKVPVEVVWRSGDEVVIAGLDGVTAIVARPTGTLLDGQAVRVRGRGEG